MASNKGFSLIELLVVLVIIGLAAKFALPNFTNSIEQMKSQTAKNNLLAIAAAQQKYFEDYNSYCTTTTGQVANCGGIGNLPINLSLAMSGTQDPFSYSCIIFGGDLYRCTANDGTVILTMDVTTANGAVVSCNLGNDSRCPN